MCLSKFQKANKQQNKGTLTGLLMESRRKGMTRAILRIPVDLLMIDERYQTPVRTERNMSYLINNWDEHKLLPLTVVPHDEEGVFAIVDGYGRLQASQKVDPVKYNELECLVLLDAPKNPKERQKFEAEQYAFQNVNVARLKAIHRHGALQVMNNQQAMDLDKLRMKYGFDYAANKGNRDSNVLGSYQDCLRILKTQGYECLDWVMTICQKTGFDRQANGYGRGIVRSMRDMWVMYSDSRDKIAKLFIKELRGKTPLVLNAEAKAKYPILYVETALSMYLEDLITEELGLEQKRYVDGTKLVAIKKVVA